MKSRIYTFDDHFKKLMKNPKFRKDWEESETERELGKSLMGIMIKRKTDYKKLSKKSKISQKTINDIILGETDPKLSILKKLAQALDTKITLQFG